MKAIQCTRSLLQSGTGDKTNVLVTPENKVNPSAVHQLTVVIYGGTPSAGTVDIRTKALHSNRFLDLLDSAGAPITLDITVKDTVVIHGAIESVQLDMTGLAGAGITGWDAVLTPLV